MRIITTCFSYIYNLLLSEQMQMDLLIVVFLLQNLMAFYEPIMPNISLQIIFITSNIFSYHYTIKIIITAIKNILVIINIILSYFSNICPCLNLNIFSMIIPIAIIIIKILLKNYEEIIRNFLLYNSRKRSLTKLNFFLKCLIISQLNLHR